MENEILDYVMETPGNTNPAILGQMLDEASGTKLPEPTIADNGKVLGVAEGAYALVNGGGGGGVLLVNEVFEDAVGTLDKTYAEIKDAAIAGKIIQVISDQSSEEFTSYEIQSIYYISQLGEQFSVGSYNKTWATQTEDGYPTISYD